MHAYCILLNHHYKYIAQLALKLNEPKNRPSTQEIAAETLQTAVKN